MKVPLGEDFSEEAIAAAVKVIGSDDMGVRRESVKEASGGGGTGRESDAVLSEFKASDTVFESVTSGVLSARVFETGVNAGRRLDEGGGLEDGSHDSAGGRVGSLTGVNGARIEMKGGMREGRVVHDEERIKGKEMKGW